MKKSGLKRKLSQKYTSLLVGLAITLAMVVVYAAGALEGLESVAEDWRVRAFYHEPHPAIAMVAITEDDMKKFGKWPWPRGVHAELLEKISAHKPRVIGMDILFMDPDPRDPAGNSRLEQITRESGNVIYPVYASAKDLEAEKGKVTNSGSYMIPLPELLKASLGVGHNFVRTDTKARSLILKIYSQQADVEAFSMAVAREYLGISGDGQDLGKYYTLGDTLVPTHGSGEMLLAYAGPPGTFPSYSYTDVLEGRVPQNAFRDKIVLIGEKVLGVGIGRNFMFPLSSVNIFQIEVFANGVDTLLNKNFFRHFPAAANLAVIIILGLLSTWIYTRGNPARNLAVMLAMAVILVALAYVVCLKTRYMANISVPAITLITCYLGNIAYGIVAERREKMKITQTFGRYVAPQVVDEILKSGDELVTMEGRMQYVTVLFVDVSGFTTISEKLSPVQVVQILNRYFKEVIEAVYMFEGTVDKFIGDAVMVVFNAPLPIDRHEEKAVRAALEIRRRINHISGDIEREFGMPLGASLGINSGEAIIGNIGAMNRVEYATIGDTVNAAARLQSLAGRNRICISGTTCDPIKDIVEVNAIGAQKVKGKADEIMVYEVIDIKS